MIPAGAVSPGQTYYDALTWKEQGMHLLMVAGIRQRATRLSLSGSKQEISRAFNAIHMQHPELFYVHFHACTAKSGFLRIVYFPMKENEIRRIHRCLDDTWQKLSAKLADMTPREQYLMIALEIAEKIKFRKNYRKTGVDSDYTVSAVACGKGVCEGMSKLFVYFCNKAGLWSQFVAGTLDGNPHSWVAIELQETKYYLDITAIQLCPAVCKLFPSLVFKTEKSLRRWGYGFD